VLWSYYNLSMCNLTLHIIIVVILSAMFLEGSSIKIRVLKNFEV